MFSLSMLLPIGTLEIDAIHEAEQRLSVLVTSTLQDSACPDCQTTSSRVHSQYTRTVTDLPWAGRTLLLLLRTRRFFCDLPQCGRKTFAELFGPALPAYARRTSGQLA